MIWIPQDKLNEDAVELASANGLLLPDPAYVTCS
jgi:hypothetical protein